MAYDLTGLQTATDIGGIITWANAQTEGALIGLFILAFGIILFFGFKRYEPIDAFLAASWISFILSVVALSVGWVNSLIMFGFLAVAGITLFIKFWKEGY